MTAGSLHEKSALELISLYKSGGASPVDVAREVITQIERREPDLKATYAFDPDGALEMAEASEARWRNGAPITRDGVTIDGIPATIKENIATKGTPVPLGTAATPLVPAERDAPPAARLREAGAVILGKTTMPEFGAMSSGLSSFHPLTRNPWNLAMNPGRLERGRGRRLRSRIWPLPYWNGYRRLRPLSGGMERTRRLQAESRPHSH